jgi:DNA mismatch endonuclease (patch repair protein)
MADIFTKSKRSEIMSKIKSKNTGPELFIRSSLHKLGYRFRLHDKKLPGTPDIILKKYNTVIFINGCFWHGHHGCKYATLPKTNSNFWLKKISSNEDRDIAVRIRLKDKGWHVITIWTCQIMKNKKLLDKIDKKIKSNLSKKTIWRAEHMGLAQILKVF